MPRGMWDSAAGGPGGVQSRGTWATRPDNAADGGRVGRPGPFAGGFPATRSSHDRIHPGRQRAVFSILTAVRNAEAALPATLESVRRQTYPRCEHVVVDGASSDGTPDLLRRAGSARLRWISEPDRGIAHAFNKGVEMAAGNVLFLGAGDRLADDRVLADVAERLRGLPRPWVAYGDCRFEYPGGSVRLVRRNFSPARFRRYCCLPHQATWVDRDLFRRYGLFDESFGIAMDYEHFARFVDRHPPAMPVAPDFQHDARGVSTEAVPGASGDDRVRIAEGAGPPRQRGGVDGALGGIGRVDAPVERPGLVSRAACTCIFRRAAGCG
ncbi:MAG: glycosyltransferase family 2 protein [Kiritimatiellia bacterium]